MLGSFEQLYSLMLFRSTASVRCGVVVMRGQAFQCRKVHVCVCVCVVGKEGEEKIKVDAEVTSEGSDT